MNRRTESDSVQIVFQELCMIHCLVAFLEQGLLCFDSVERDRSLVLRSRSGRHVLEDKRMAMYVYSIRVRR
jgi:hypothetical protein